MGTLRATLLSTKVLFLRRRRRGLDVVRQPREALEQTLAGGGTAGHDVPDLVLELGKLQRLGDFLGFHGCREEGGQRMPDTCRVQRGRTKRRQRTIVDILLVGKHEQKTVLHLAIVDDAVQLGPGLLDARAVGRVDDEDQTLGTWAVCQYSCTLELVAALLSAYSQQSRCRPQR